MFYIIVFSRCIIKLERAACEVLPLRKGGGGAGKVLAMLKGGGGVFTKKMG